MSETRESGRRPAWMVNAAEKWEELDDGFVHRTYRSSAVIVGFTCLYLAARGWMAYVLPVFCGAALSLGIYWLNDFGFGLLFAPNEKDSVADKRARSKRLRKVFWVALVKYLGVAAIAALVVRYWDITRIAAFAGGFCLIPFGIVLRVISRLLLARMNKSSK